MVIRQAEEMSGAKAERLKTQFMATAYPDDFLKGFNQEIPKEKSVELPGVSFLVTKEKADKLVDTLNKMFNYRHYHVFVSDEQYVSESRNTVSIIKSKNQFDILRLQQTDRINYNLTTDSVIKHLEYIDSLYGLQIIGADLDWCEFKLKKNPRNWKEFSNDIYKFCPDIVDQGTSTFKVLESEIKATNKIFFWWD